MPTQPALTEARAETTSTVDALAAVRRLSFAAIEASDAEAIHRALAGELLRVARVDQVHLTRLAPDGSLGRSREYHARPDGDPVPGAEYVNRFDQLSAVQLVMETGELVNEPDAPSSTVMNPALTERFGAASGLFVPLAFDGEVRSVAALISQTPRAFADREVQLVYTLANQASVALAALEMRNRLSARADRDEALARAAAALNARLDLRAVLDTLCREADLALGGDLAGVYLGDAQGGVAAAGHGVAPDSDWYGYVMRPGEGVAGQVLVSGEPAVSNSYQADVELPATDALRTVETAVAVPVRWDGELKGALSVGFYSMRHVDDEDIESIQAIADLAGVACSNAEAFERAQRAARTDSLTGLLNHGAVQVRLREEISRARRSGRPLCCLLIDLDNFKEVNDLHGHLTGDRLLWQVAGAIVTEFRPYDGIGRFGGDEFVLVLPDTDEETALAAAGRLQRVVTDAGRAVGDAVTALTISVGIASWTEPLTASELLDRADRALLVAKRRGKDAAVVSGPGTADELMRLEAQPGSPTRVVNGLWDVVSQCERPRELLDRLPSFVRRSLDLEEVVLYVPDAAARAGTLQRGARARIVGDPSPGAFRQSRLASDQERLASLRTGAIARPSLSELHRSLGVRAERSPSGEIAGSYGALALARDGHLYGLLLLRSAARELPPTALRMTELIAGQAVTALVGQLGGASRSAVGALAAAIDARDNYTHAHSEQVVALAAQTARLLGLPDAEVDRVRDGAMLHDVGKVAIPNEILYKPGPLTEGEFAIMREHPVIGERILRRTPELEAIAPLVRHEHERWDGRGYPDGLAGTEIPIGSRVIFACDAYNAMITARPYRKPMSEEEAVAELERGAGSQFDPQVVDALLLVLAERGMPVG